MPDLKEYRKIHAEPSQCRESALNSSSESKSGEDCRSEACSLYIREKLYAQKKKQKKKTTCGQSFSHVYSQELTGNAPVAI